MKNLILLTVFFLSIARSFSQWIPFNKKNSSLISDTVFFICADSLNNKWIGTSQGVSKFDGTNWTHFTVADGLADNKVQCIAIDTSGNKWFGTIGGGVSCFSNNSLWKTYKKADGLINDTVNFIFIDKNIKWFGTQNGLSKFDGTNWTTFSKVDGLASNLIWCVFRDDQQNIWAGTNMGLSIYNGSSWTTYTVNDGLTNNLIWCINKDSKGNLWIGTDNGLVKYNYLSFQKFYIPISGSREIIGPVVSIAVDNENNKWFVSPSAAFSGSGVHQFNDSIWIKYSRNSGYANSNLTSFCIDKSGDKWIAMFNGGIAKFDKSFMPVSQISISPQIVSIAVDSDTSLEAILTPDKAIKRNIKWSSSDSKIAIVDSIGNVTGIKSGMCDISATINEGIIGINNTDSTGLKTGKCSIIVIPQNDLESNIQSFDIFPNPAAQYIILSREDIIKTEIIDLAGRSKGFFYGRQINISSFSSGIYILNIYGKEGLLYIRKILVDK